MRRRRLEKVTKKADMQPVSRIRHPSNIRVTNFLKLLHGMSGIGLKRLPASKKNSPPVETAGLRDNGSD